MPATCALSGTPASISASDAPQTEAMDDEPLDSRMSETTRVVCGDSSLAGRPPRRKPGRAVGGRQVGRLDRDRPDLVRPATVHADALLDDQPSHRLALDLLEGGPDGRLPRVVEPDGAPDLVEHAAPPAPPR